MRYRTYLLLIATAVACGKEPKTSGLPPKPEELTTDLADEGAKAAQAQWAALASALGIAPNLAGSEAELKAQLASPPTFLNSARAKDHATLVGKIAQGYGAKAYATRCASIDGVQELGPAKTVDPATGQATDFAGAKLYLMKYKLQADATGKAETESRSGLLTIPTQAGGQAVLAAYAHGGAFGLGYGEIAGALGELQGSHVVIAPTYPGEPLCKQAVDAATRSCDAAGVAVAAGTAGDPYDADADELLGMYDCVARATIGKADGPMLAANGTATGATLGAALQGVVKRHGTGTLAQLPQGILLGASRGGLVAEIALAKTGAALAAIGAATTADPLGPAYLSPSYFSCAAVVSGPTSFTFAEFRLFLEQWVKGRVASTSFIAFPGIAPLAGLFEPYRSGAIDADAAMLLVAKRDGALTSPLAVAALRNWTKFEKGTSNGAAGALLSMHGTADKVVPISQAALFFNVMLGTSTSPAVVGSDPAKAPGLTLTSRAFAPKSEGGLQHGDASFFASTAIVPGDFVSSAVTEKALPVVAGETAAQGIAKTMAGGAEPTTAQLKVARSYVLMGVLQPTGTPKPVPVSDALVHLAEEDLTPAKVMGLWRTGSCANALK